MDLIKRYGRRGSFGPRGMFSSPRLSNESLIGLHGRYNKEVVKLRAGFYLALSKKIKPKVGDPVGGCPHEAFGGTAARRASPEKIPDSKGQRRTRGRATLVLQEGFYGSFLPVGVGACRKLKLRYCSSEWDQILPASCC